jgi:hypothetical protein
VRACAGLPIALRIAGTRLAARPSRSVRWLADRLAVPTAALDELKVGRLDVRAGLAEVCRGLDSAQAHAFHTLAAAGLPSVTAREAAVLLGIPQSRAEDLLEFFVDRYLLACADAGHYEFRAFTRAFGRELETHGPAGGPCPPQCMSPVSRAERRGAER